MPEAATELSELDAIDFEQFFGATGPLAQHLSGFELRPSQAAMAQAVKRAILAQGNALIEAPTGTGKSIAYLAPAILSGKTVVVATANKSLQNQLFTKDIPFLRTVLDRTIDAIVIKGRSNYVCTLKWEKELVEQRMISLYGREDEQVSFLRDWLTETSTGDVDDLPFMLKSDLRPRIVSFPDDCLHSQCRFYHDQCWVNFMRDEAARAQILVTNHHLLLNALELGEAGTRILPPAAIYIVDEAHQLEPTATSVYETTVTDYTVELLLRRNVFDEHLDEDELDELRFQNTLAFQEIALLQRENSYRIEGELEECKKLATALRRTAQRLKEQSPYGTDEPDEPVSGADVDPEVGEARKTYELAIEALNSSASKMATVATATHDDRIVRYAVRVFDRRQVTLEVHAAPVDPASLLRRFLFQPEDDEGAVPRTVICTSATLATDGHFEHFKQRCGIDDAVEELVLPPVFDYPQQTLLYQPALPAFDWRNASAYYDAAVDEIARLLEVSRGRTLCLFTSWSGLQQVNDRLRRLEAPVIWPLQAQGDAPRNALLTWFLQTPNSVLLATRSFWEGVDIPGDDLSMVVLDKMPFPTPNDPLHSARMKAIEEAGGSSFGEYMAPLMSLTLKQGFGRLIRRRSDLGVVAILDERLTSKAYGRRARQDLPPARYSRAFRDVHHFFQTALATEAEFALNVWARPADESQTESGATIQWRWQLLRLLDGRADEEIGTISSASVVEAEVYAALEGLRNLRARIERAQRQPGQFTVEVRCTQAAAGQMEAGNTSLIEGWQREKSVWQDVAILTVDHEIVQASEFDPLLPQASEH